MFREIGLADELGSGMRNTYKYTKMYSGGEPQFAPGDVFRITIPLTEVATATVGPNGSGSADGTRNGTVNETRNETVNLSQTEKNILVEIRKNPHITKNEICDILGVGKSTVARATKKLKDSGIIERIGGQRQDTGKFPICNAREMLLLDFRYCFLSPRDIQVPLVESMVIERFKPVWNCLLEGFRNHTPTRGRSSMMTPSWDWFHPGRAWAANRAAVHEIGGSSLTLKLGDIFQIRFYNK